MREVTVEEWANGKLKKSKKEMVESTPEDNRRAAKERAKVKLDEANATTDPKAEIAALKEALSVLLDSPGG